MSGPCPVQRKREQVAMSSGISRNAPCPCGSGEKHKNCCGKSNSILNAGQKKVIGISALVIAGIVAAIMIFANNQPAFSPAFSPSAAPIGFPAGTPAAGGVSRPSGPAPAGKVWSFEHGHWHDAPGATPTTQPGLQTLGQPLGQLNQSTATFTPQPSGDPPSGKVWSTQHGHWHDAPATGTVPAAGGTGP